jgi:hypothetical protein
VEIRYDKKGFILVLQPDSVREAANVVSQMQTSSWPVAC